MDKSRITVT